MEKIYNDAIVGVGVVVGMGIGVVVGVIVVVGVGHSCVNFTHAIIILTVCAPLIELCTVSMVAIQLIIRTSAGFLDHAVFVQVVLERGRSSSVYHLISRYSVVNSFKVCIHIHIDYTYTHMYTHMNICICICIHIHIDTYTLMYTHRLILSSQSSLYKANEIKDLESRAVSVVSDS